jgi:hypothetical protein
VREREREREKREHNPQLFLQEQMAPWCLLPITNVIQSVCLITCKPMLLLLFITYVTWQVHAMLLPAWRWPATHSLPYSLLLPGASLLSSLHHSRSEWLPGTSSRATLSPPHDCDCSVSKDSRHLHLLSAWPGLCPESQ